jgi:predicted RNA-binding protein with PUA-like domain
MHYWLVKSEPFKYSWEQFIKDKRAVWDGVRNYAARNNLRSMEKGDWVFFYHSNEGLEIVGIAEVVKPHYQDPTSDNPAWLAVDLKPKKPLQKTVTLSEIKNNKKLAEMQFLKIARLSVSAVSEAEFEIILQMANTKI